MSFIASSAGLPTCISLSLVCSTTMHVHIDSVSMQMQACCESWLFCCYPATVAGKTPEEIRKTFNIKVGCCHLLKLLSWMSGRPCDKHTAGATCRTVQRRTRLIGTSEFQRANACIVCVANSVSVTRSTYPCMRSWSKYKLHGATGICTMTLTSSHVAAVLCYYRHM